MPFGAPRAPELARWRERTLSMPPWATAEIRAGLPLVSRSRFPPDADKPGQISEIDALVSVDNRPVTDEHRFSATWTPPARPIRKSGATYPATVEILAGLPWVSGSRFPAAGGGRRAVRDSLAGGGALRFWGTLRVPRNVLVRRRRRPGPRQRGSAKRPMLPTLPRRPGRSRDALQEHPCLRSRLRAGQQRLLVVGSRPNNAGEHEAFKVTDSVDVVDAATVRAMDECGA